MTAIVDFAINRARMILSIFVCALLAGLAAFITLPREADPDIPFPFVIVVVPLDGISPEDAERLLERMVEKNLKLDIITFGTIIKGSIDQPSYLFAVDD